MLRLVLGSVSLVLFPACGAGDVNPPPPLHDTGDGGSGSDVTEVEAAPGTVTETGVVKALQLLTPVSGGTITAGTATTTTDAKGAYTLHIDPTTPFNMQIQAPGYYSLNDQLTQAKVDLDLGTVSLLSEGTATLLTATLPGYDANFGVLSVAAVLLGTTCADEGGATFEYTVDGQPPSSSKLIYFASGIPSTTATSAESGAFPHAAIYNITPGKTVSVTVKHPTCTMVPFPVDRPIEPPTGSGVLTYINADIVTSGGKNTSFLRLFLK